MSDVSLVVTDLDGTLWRTDDNVHPAVVQTFGTLAGRGVPVLVATGRRLASTRAPLARIGQSPPAVVLNGSLGVDLASGDRFHRAPFEPEDALGALRAFSSSGLEPCVYVDHERYDVFVGGSPSTSRGHLAQLAGTAARVQDLEAAVRSTPVLAYGIIGIPAARLKPAVAALRAVASVYHDRAFDFPGMASLMVEPAGQSKWSGVQAFCAARGLDPERVLAVGDGPNDVELLRAAMIAVSPTSAHPAALAVAGHTVPPPAAGGWAGILDLV